MPACEDKEKRPDSEFTDDEKDAGHKTPAPIGTGKIITKWGREGNHSTSGLPKD
jgi:hypothetical protein